MNFAVTVRPAAVVNRSGVVSPASNGMAQAACRYSASVSTQPTPPSDPGASRCAIWPRVAAAMALLISPRAFSGCLSSGTRATPAP